MPRKRSILPRTLAPSAVALAASSGYLLMRLSAESERAQDASRAHEAQALEIARLERQRDVLERELARLRRAALDTGSCDHEEGTSQAEETASGAAGARAFPPFGAIPARLRKMSALRAYGELARELKLSPEETDQLIELIVEQEEASFAGEASLPADPTQLQRHFEAIEQRKEAAIAEFLGPERATQYRDYRASIGQRAELRMIRDHLEVLGTPLEDKQRQRLLAIMIEENARSPASKLGPTSTARDFEQLQQQQAETRRRVRERAESVLDPEQRKRLDEYYAMQQPLPALAGTAGERSPPGEEE